LALTGGGAKGFYEAGIIHALHITGMEFDVITGSSIGAFNSLFFAE
jgi:NTE family protein